MEIRAVKPLVWNFRIVGGRDAWREVVYSARLSGVPENLEEEEVFRMMVRNDYGSALEHIVIKFDVKMSKGMAPEFLEHRIVSHTGFSTRYLKADEGIEKEKRVYEVIVPWHLLGRKEDDPFVKGFWRVVEECLREYERMLEGGLPREAARYLLPFCQAVGIYHVTMNLRSLLNLLGLRLCVRASPEFRCLASQLYFLLLENLPLLRGLVGCRGFMLRVCPEEGVTGVRSGKPHPFYPPCPFRNPKSKIFLPTKGEKPSSFDPSKALKVQEELFLQWASWGEKPSREPRS
ncbi:MAG: FAD-dependent thymidylate synthase [Hadesarchaea archaeon]|nr:MAG: FAD-dependent thymidylate synthase [Hadesarchaea archaeon]